MSSALSLGIITAMPATLAAQEIPDEFSLPSPSPTPTPAPQGPADERAGVRIAPRIIPEERSPAPEPPPPQSTASQPLQRATQRSTPETTQPTRNNQAQRSSAPSSSRNETSPDNSQRATASAEETANVLNENAEGAGIAIGEPTGPGFETFEDEQSATTGTDGWYDVDDVGDDTENAASPQASSSDAGVGSTFSSGSFVASVRDNTAWMSAAIALLIALMGAAGWLLWQRRSQQALALAAPEFDLANGVKRTFGDVTPPKRRAKGGSRAAPKQSVDTDRTAQAQSDLPEIAAMREPAKVDLGLTINEASRSVMRFTIEFTLEVFNRSDFALRDLNLSAKLACAQRGATNAAPFAVGQPISEIERIGPQQSRRVTGRLQLPIEEITPISQGGKPVLIPLIHLHLEAAGQPPIDRTFVVGTPSTTSKTRVHPLLLEGPPGGFAKLRAQLIRQPDPHPTTRTKSTETV